jgi:replication initiation protein RepC
MPESMIETTTPSGLRRFTPAMLGARNQADAFAGAPRGSGKPFRYLAAFQEAEPYLGLPPQAYKLLAWLVKQTMAHDWEEGSRPICWPSAARQAEFLGLSPARVKVLNRALFEAGIFIIRDSETGKRYGRRGPDNRIIEAYGFDLSPLAYRYEEFIRIAAEAKAERERMKALRKRATRARRAIRQIGETLAALNAMPAEWPRLGRAAGRSRLDRSRPRKPQKPSRSMGQGDLAPCGNKPRGARRRAPQYIYKQTF